MSPPKKNSQAKEKNKFPQISRIIPAKLNLKACLPRLFIGFIILGSFFFLLFNWYLSYQQPEHLKELLKNPGSVETLASVLKTNTNPNLDLYLKTELAKLGREALSSEVAKIRAKQLAKLREIQSLLELYPDYPDGFAYLSVLAYNLGDCKLAQSALKRALKLDPTRPIFLQLEIIIKKCDH